MGGEGGGGVGEGVPPGFPPVTGPLSDNPQPPTSQAGLFQSAHRDKCGPGRVAGRAGCAVLLVLAPDSPGVSSRAALVFIPLPSCFLPPDGDH